MKIAGSFFVEEPYLEDFVRQFNNFSQSTELGNTAEFWIWYINHVNLPITYKSCQENNFYMY